MIDVEITEAIQTLRREDDVALVHAGQHGERWSRVAVECRSLLATLHGPYRPMASDLAWYRDNWYNMLDYDLQRIEDALLDRGVRSS